MPLKMIKGVALAIALMGIAQGAVLAQTVEVAGQASGSFVSNNSTTLGGLTYLGSTFDVTTQDGFTTVGNNSANPNIDNLGSFTLATNPHTNYNGQQFTLDVDFTLPTGITGGNPATWNAVLKGSVVQNGNGVAINFNDVTGQTFNFNDGTQTGTISLQVNNLSVNAGGLTESVTGNITANTTLIPEPSSAALFLPGLFGLGGLLRRRKKVA